MFIHSVEHVIWFVFLNRSPPHENQINVFPNLRLIDRFYSYHSISTILGSTFIDCDCMPELVNVIYCVSKAHECFKQIFKI